MNPRGLFKSVSGSKKNGSETRKRRAIARAIVSGVPIKEDSRYKREFSNLRQIAEDCTPCEYPDTFYTEGKAIDTLFDFAYIDGFLTPSEQCEFLGAWLYLKEKWNL